MFEIDFISPKIMFTTICVLDVYNFFMLYYWISVRFCRFKCHIRSFIKVNCAAHRKQQQSILIYYVDSARFVYVCECILHWKPNSSFLSMPWGSSHVSRRRMLIASIESKQHLFDVHHCSNVTHLHCIISWIKDVPMSDVFVYICVPCSSYSSSSPSSSSSFNLK